MFQLLLFICGLLLSSWLYFTGALGSTLPYSGSKLLGVMGSVPFLIAIGIYALIFVPAGLALKVRRWHDIGNSGWTIVVIVLLSCIPLIGFLAWIVDLVAMCWPGDTGRNQYGPPVTSA
jgi:uncharacterized membrane protein YhaH (DUF805 family)